MTHQDWLIDLINDNGHLAWVQEPCVGSAPIDVPALRIYPGRDDTKNVHWMLVSHPELTRIYAPEDIPTMRPVWDETLRWEAA